ncbi:MAG: hypothetical protein AAGI53_15425 [Planctomycetota bacterium]
MSICITVATSFASTDPSLSISSEDAYVSTAAISHDTLLDHGGIRLEYDATTDDFDLNINGTSVSTVTSDDAEGNPMFSGTYSDQSVEGCYITGSSRSKYTIEISGIDANPKRFGVEIQAGVPVVINLASCDCSDGIDLSCNNNKCDDEDDCGLATDAKCEWTDQLV